MFSLSKGLGAPVGSMLCGPAEWISEARIVRKRFGGGMRQVGVLAAAGLVALEEGPPRLPEDHHHAALLAAGLEEIPGVGLLGGPVDTNIVVFRLEAGGVEPSALVAELRREGVLIGQLQGGRLRMVTHRDVDEGGLRRALEVLRRILVR
jgi:threonine aldolase